MLTTPPLSGRDSTSGHVIGGGDGSIGRQITREAGRQRADVAVLDKWLMR
jgi:hypothetical protein